MQTLAFAASQRGVPVVEPLRAAGNTKPTSDDVTASEIACYAYCAKAWHIEHVQRLAPPSETMDRRAAGVRAHEMHGRDVELMSTLVRRQRWFVVVLLFLAVLAALVAALI